MLQEVETPSPENAVDLLLTLDSGTADQPSLQFANVGTGRQVGHVKTHLRHGVSGPRESPTAVSQLLNGQHTFTHHLYHHYDVEPSLHQRQDRSTTHGNACCLLVFSHWYMLTISSHQCCRSSYGTFESAALPSARQHPIYDDCLEVNREYYQNCCVLDCVTQCSQSAAHLCELFLQVQQIGFVTLGPLRCA